jgi:hypothetical protein
MELTVDYQQFHAVNGDPATVPRKERAQYNAQTDTLRYSLQWKDEYK